MRVFGRDSIIVLTLMVLVVIGSIPAFAGCGHLESRGALQLREMGELVNSLPIPDLLETQRYPVPKGLCSALMTKLKEGSLEVIEPVHTTNSLDDPMFDRYVPCADAKPHPSDNPYIAFSSLRYFGEYDFEKYLIGEPPYEFIYGRSNYGFQSGIGSGYRSVDLDRCELQSIYPLREREIGSGAEKIRPIDLSTIVSHEDGTYIMHLYDTRGIPHHEPTYGMHAIDVSHKEQSKILCIWTKFEQQTEN